MSAVPMAIDSTVDTGYRCHVLVWGGVTRIMISDAEDPVEVITARGHLPAAMITQLIETEVSRLNSIGESD